MLRRLELTEGSARIERPTLRAGARVAEEVRAIVARVREGGDAALRELGRLHDGVELEALEVSPQEWRAARGLVREQAREDLRRAWSQIHAFHRAQHDERPLRVETAPGVVCERRSLPIERVGCYVPGGSAPLVSTLLMLGVPSAIAGCGLRVFCTPPRADGSLDPHLLFAAELCGVERVFKLGGAQAIAAMAWGTESVPAVDKLFGPGNAWVTEAKQQAAADPDGAACDLPAGPSELLVIADQAAEPAFVAADLLSQAEHGPDSQVVLLTDSEPLARAVLEELERRLPLLARSAIAAKALAGSCYGVTASLEEALELSNAYAPEHLILQLREPRAWAERVRNAGSVFLGAWTPEAVGDYASGTNHVLPTYGHARALGGLGVEAFRKSLTFQELTPGGLRDLGPVVERLAELEGLGAHREAVSVRLARLAAPGRTREASA